MVLFRFVRKIGGTIPRRNLNRVIHSEIRSACVRKNDPSRKRRYSSDSSHQLSDFTRRLVRPAYSNIPLNTTVLNHSAFSKSNMENRSCWSFVRYWDSAGPSQTIKIYELPKEKHRHGAFVWHFVMDVAQGQARKGRMGLWTHGARPAGVSRLVYLLLLTTADSLR